jgi:glycosyltransferase involved in cell wall biosynthesis
MTSYILITPVRNEAAYIQKTIKAVISQTVTPERWLIVSDGSTDRTDEIVESYARSIDFIELVRIDRGERRNFGSKVKAFRFGYDMIKNEEYDFLGILDADVSFNEKYYESILSKFVADENLGIAGGQKYDTTGNGFYKVPTASISVAGPFQLFRRKCFEDTGGFTPIPLGGEDAVIETKARMSGWKVETFPELRVYHHRRTGTASVNIFRGRFRDGIQDYLIGYHPIFEFLRCSRRMFQKPYVFGALALLSGYTWAAVLRRERPVSAKFVSYLRSEQLTRIFRLLRKKNHDRCDLF